MTGVLVTGATGFIGYEVARQLAATGLRPRLLVSRPEGGLLLRGLDAELVQGDLTRPASLARAVEGVGAVIHLGARATFEAYRALRPTIVDGSIALAEAAVRAGVQRFVYASSLLVYASQPDPINAHTPADPQMDDGRAKVAAETALGRIFTGPSRRLACIRLPHVYGARDLMFEQIRRRRLFLPGRTGNRYAHLHVEDAARLLVAEATQGWSGTTPVEPTSNPRRGRSSSGSWSSTTPASAGRRCRRGSREPEPSCSVRSSSGDDARRSSPRVG